MLQEKVHSSANGYGALIVLLGLAGVCIFGFFEGAMRASAIVAVAMIFGGIGALLLLKGLFIVNPNEGRVLQLFGNYIGTVRDPGLRWTNPFYSLCRARHKGYYAEQYLMPSCCFSEGKTRHPYSA